MKEIKVIGTTRFAETDIQIIEGGFGENCRIMTAHTIAQIHGVSVKHINELTNNNLEEFEDGIDVLNLLKMGKSIQEINELFYVNLPPVTKNFYIYSEQGYSKLMSIRKDRSIVIEVLKTYFNTNINIPTKFGRKELRFMEELEDVLQVLGFTLIKQYSVLKYRIDGYIPELNVAIEYDENGHVGYSSEAHEYRQKEIEELIGCKFIRVTDKYTNGKNIGMIIKSLLNNKSDVFIRSNITN